ncbi:hypothetical protein JCM10213_002716 [Rhodosporidiobolus nylandii]
MVEGEEDALRRLAAMTLEERLDAFSLAAASLPPAGLLAVVHLKEQYQNFTPAQLYATLQSLASEAAKMSKQPTDEAEGQNRSP